MHVYPVQRLQSGLICALKMEELISNSFYKLIT